MKVCIRCNPVSQLLTDENGEMYCPIHGKNYILEEQPDRVEFGPSVDEPVTETKLYEDGAEATGPAPLPEQSPAEQEAQQ